jgi:hypothetical protein
MNTRQNRRLISFFPRYVEIRHRRDCDFFGNRARLRARRRSQMMSGIRGLIADIFRICLILSAMVAYVAMFYFIAFLNPSTSVV